MIHLATHTEDPAATLRSAECSDGGRIDRGGYTPSGTYANHWFYFSATGASQWLGRTAEEALSKLLAGQACGLRVTSNDEG